MEREIIGNIGGLYMCGYISIYYKNNNRKFDIKKLTEKLIIEVLIIQVYIKKTILNLHLRD